MVPFVGEKMVKVTVATFNVENLFARFNFRQSLSTDEKNEIIKEGWLIDDTRFVVHKQDARRITAEVIKKTRADIIALQEVENLDVLKRFNSAFLNSRYKYKLLVDGNDPRQIDVAVLSKYPFEKIVTHQFDRKGRSYIFSRDCLEVHININGVIIPFFVNHLKSLVGGRQRTMARRKKQSERILQILKERFKQDLETSKFIVLGDFNDYMPSEGLAPLVNQTWLEDVIQRLNPEERWTHYYAKKKERKQLDYILLSKKLAETNPNSKPKIFRKGLPLRAGISEPLKLVKGTLKASDHCPVYIELDI